MMLAVPPVAAAARALAVAEAAGGLVAADTHPPVTRAPATAAMASTAATRFLCMTNIPLHQGAALTAGSSRGMRRHAVGRGRGARRSHRLDAALVAAGAKDQRDGEQPGGDDDPQQHHGLLHAQARVPPGAARTVGRRPPAPYPDLLACRHLLAR